MAQRSSKHQASWPTPAQHFNQANLLCVPSPARPPPTPWRPTTPLTYLEPLAQPSHPPSPNSPASLESYHTHQPTASPHGQLACTPATSPLARHSPMTYTSASLRPTHHQTTASLVRHHQLQKPLSNWSPRSTFGEPQKKNPSDGRSPDRETLKKNKPPKHISLRERQQA